MIVGITHTHHRSCHVAELRKIALANGTARLNHRCYSPIQKVEQHLRELGTRCVVGHGIGAYDHHGANDFLVVARGAEARQRTTTKTLPLRAFDCRFVLGRRRIALEQYRFALIAGAAVKPIHRHPLRGCLEQQAIVVRFALPRIGTQFYFCAIARNLHNLFNSQIMAVEQYRLIAHRRRDRRINLGGHCILSNAADA